MYLFVVSSPNVDHCFLDALYIWILRKIAFECRQFQIAPKLKSLGNNNRTHIEGYAENLLLSQNLGIIEKSTVFVLMS